MCVNPIFVRGKYDSDDILRFNWNSSIYDFSAGILFSLPCGNCVECLRQRSSEWTRRIIDEASFYDKNCFLTLTFNEKCVPFEVSPRDVQLFLKRLFDGESLIGIRRFYCGEYGSINGRPHYHIILFGYMPEDIYPFFIKEGIQYYRSSTIEKYWRFGFSCITAVNFRTAKYCTKYMQKSIGIINQLKGRTPPFIRASNRPGIGYLRAHNINEVSFGIQYYGKVCSFPRYYLKVLKREKPTLWCEIRAKQIRYEHNILLQSDYDVYKRNHYYKFNIENGYDFYKLYDLNKKNS